MPSRSDHSLFFSKQKIEILMSMIHVIIPNFFLLYLKVEDSTQLKVRDHEEQFFSSTTFFSREIRSTKPTFFSSRPKQVSDQITQSNFSSRDQINLQKGPKLSILDLCGSADLSPPTHKTSNNTKKKLQIFFLKNLHFFEKSFFLFFVDIIHKRRKDKQ